MKIAIIFTLACSSALASLTISSASVGSDGRTFSVTMNGTALTGSTASCFRFSGGAAAQFNAAAASAVIGSGSSVTVVSAAPAYHPDAVSIALAANPTCAMTGSTGNAASSSTVATNSSDYYAGGDAHWAGLITYQGSVSVQSDGNGYPNTAQFTSPNASIDFALTSSAGTIAVWTFNFSNAITLITDGSISSRVPLSGSAVYTETAFTGLNTGAHVFRIEQSSAASSYPYFQALRCPGCVFGARAATRPIFGLCGASVVDIQGGGGATENADQTHYGLLSAAFGITAQGLSSSGQPLFTFLETNCPDGMQPQGGAHPAFAFMEPDSNDLAYSVSLGNYQSAGQATTTGIMAAAAAPAKLYWIAPNVSANSNSSVGNCNVSAAACYASYTAVLAAGVAAAANANTTFVHTVALASGAPDWMNSLCAPAAGADLQSDCLHPNAATAISQPGYGKFANREAPIVGGQILGYSFSVSGPATAVQNSASSPFTSTIAGSASGVTWMDVVTVHSSASSDRICIVGGACGTGSVALPGGLGSSAFQFTVQSTTTGARTISYTGLPDGWVSPASAALTISPAPTTGTYFLMGRK